MESQLSVADCTRTSGLEQVTNFAAHALHGRAVFRAAIPCGRLYILKDAQRASERDVGPVIERGAAGAHGCTPYVASATRIDTASATMDKASAKLSRIGSLRCVMLRKLKVKF